LVLHNTQLAGLLPADLGREHLGHLDHSWNILIGTLLPARLLDATELHVFSLAGSDISEDSQKPPAPPTPCGLQELNAFLVQALPRGGGEGAKPSVAAQACST
jgi:hypothetical protein